MYKCQKKFYFVADTPHISNFYINTFTADYVVISWTYKADATDVTPVGLSFVYGQLGEDDATTFPEKGYISASNEVVKIKGSFEVDRKYKVTVKLYEGNNTLNTDIGGLDPIIYAPGMSQIQS